MADLQLVTTAEPQPDYLQLPLDRPLETWDHEWLVDVPVGVHRHVVRFIAGNGRVYVLKELPARLAEREWTNLRHLSDEELPVVDVLGVISERGPELEDILVTRHLEFSLPYRFLFADRGIPRLRESLIDAMAALLVRLHLAGFWWGDCSLSNTLFRRDAGALAAWLVDTETGELHESLTDGQRRLELEIAQVNILGGLMDLDARGRLPEAVDPEATVISLHERYDQLWAELTGSEDVPATERHRIDDRLRRLNDLGFDTTEIQVVTEDGTGIVHFRPAVIEAGHHRRLLRQLTGIDAQEGQARRLLNDLQSYRAWLSAQERRDLPQAIGAARWLTEVYEPALAAIPGELRDRREEPELFHEVLVHRDALVEQRDQAVRVPAAAADYARTRLPQAETERTVLAEGPELGIG